MSLPDTAAGVRLTLFLNHQCNLRCVYCYNGAAFERQMPAETLRRAIDFGFEQAERRYLLVSFFGGEPMLELERMEEAAAYATREGERRGVPVSFSLSTNGTLLDEPRLEFLKRYRVGVQLSMDGCALAQDTTRPFPGQRPSFGVVSENLRRLLDAKLGLRVVAVIDPRNVSALPESFTAIAALGARAIYFGLNSHADWSDAAKAEFERSCAALADRWAETLRQGLDLRLDPFEGKVISRLLMGSCSAQRCGFGMNEFAVSPSGAIYPCDRVVKRDDDTEIQIGHLATGLDAEKMGRLNEARSFVDPECRECELNERCSRHCGCHNYEETGHVGKVSPITCWFDQCVIRETDRVANQLFEERNPIFLRRFYRGALEER